MFWLKNKKAIFLLRTLNKNFHCKIVNIFLPIIYSICFGCSKEQSHREGSFEHPKHIFWMTYVLDEKKKVVFLLRTLNKNFQRKIVNIFLPIILAYVLGAQKELSHLDSSFEYPQHMFWLKKFFFYYALLAKVLTGSLNLLYFSCLPDVRWLLVFCGSSSLTCYH